MMAPTSESNDHPSSARANTSLRGHVLALLVLVGALVVVLLMWRVARDREVRNAQAAFEVEAREITDLLRQRLVHFELITGGGAALFATVTLPTPSEWHAYADSLKLEARFPGIVGFGFASYTPQARLDDLQVGWRDAGNGLLEVRPKGVRPVYGPVLYLEPRTLSNITAIGFDMYAEPVRRAAMERAMRTGTPQLTGPVQLVQDTTPHVSVMLFRPLYRLDAVPRTERARESAMQGWVSLPLRVETFVLAALGDSHDKARFRIVDVTSDPRELYRSAEFGDTKATAAFRHAITLDHYGRRWRLDFNSEPLELASPRLGSLEGLLALGVIVSLLLYAVALTLARTEATAHRLARRMTEDLRRSEQRFRTAMQHSAIGVALLDGNDVIVEANSALGGLVARDAGSLAGRRIDSLFEDGGAEEPAHALDAPGVRRATRRLRREGDVSRQVLMTYAPVPGNVGEDIAGLVQVEDVTERLRAEARVHALNRTLEARVDLRTRELQQANAELEAFAYSVSHDLRAPLRAIDGFSRALQDRHSDMLDAGARSYLDRVRQAAARMSSLIDALLGMTRVSRVEMRPVPVDVSRMAHEAIEELRAGDPGHVVDVEIEAGLAAQGDPTLVRNLLDNLLGNAWKFTRGRDQPRIEVRSGDPAIGMREFLVTDNGAGFSVDYADKLFKPFQRLHAASDFEGHGVGLASVRRIVERHGGQVGASGRVGEGATFWFTLPE